MNIRLKPCMGDIGYIAQMCEHKRKSYIKQVV